MVMDGHPRKLLKDADVQEFYLGLHGEGRRRASATSSTTRDGRDGSHESGESVSHGW